MTHNLSPVKPLYVPETKWLKKMPGNFSSNWHGQLAEKEIFLYTDLADCVHQIEKVIALTPMKADAVRTAARQRSVVCGYQYKDRAMLALQLIKQQFA